MQVRFACSAEADVYHHNAGHLLHAHRPKKGCPSGATGDTIRCICIQIHEVAVILIRFVPLSLDCKRVKVINYCFCTIVGPYTCAYELHTVFQDQSSDWRRRFVPCLQDYAILRSSDVYAIFSNVVTGVLQEWLQIFAWTEADISQCLANRAMLPGVHDIQQEPMFCFETAIKLLYWSGLAYEHDEVGSPSIA
jgi:hypothetical protein